MYPIEPSERYYIGLWEVNCLCKEDPSGKVCNCVSCKSDDINEIFNSKQLFESLLWKPNYSKLYKLYTSNIFIFFKHFYL